MNYYCNPMNIQYRYQLFDRGDHVQASRESADPTMIFFRGKYYLFPSMAAGFYTSEDLCTYTFHAYQNPMPIYGYAPDVRIIKGEMYFCTMEPNRNLGIYKSADPVTVPFTKVNEVAGGGDPCLFEDEDGRVYLYWGCSNTRPIYGIELNPDDMSPVGCRQVLIYSDPANLGYERNGENNTAGSSATYMEGPYMTKHKGRYYLQYATTGTAYNVYCDGVYTADRPLGPFTPARNNPFSYQPAGFITGAGHGSTFAGAAGRYFHTSCLRISKHHPFERRLGLWPVGFDEQQEMYCDQRYGDWPKRSDAKPFDQPEWMLLSYQKKAAASSGKQADCICDEDIRTWWQADTPENQWVALDLGAVCDVRAVQINFADDKIMLDHKMIEGKGIARSHERVIDQEHRVTRWCLEGSADGEHYFVIKDKSQADTDLAHDFVVPEDGVRARYIRLRIVAVPFNVNPCISGLRVFGRMDKARPKAPGKIRGRFAGALDAYVFWEKAEGATGYNLLWGHEPDRLYHSCLVYGANEKLISALVKGQKLFVRADAFNEAGISQGAVAEIKVE